MIDLERDKLLTLRQAAQLLPPRAGKPVHATTLWRWATAGLTRGSRTYRLEVVRVGRALFTTAEALNEYVRELGAAGPRRSLPATRRRTHQDAVRELRERWGIGCGRTDGADDARGG